MKVHASALKHGVVPEDAVQAADLALWIEPLEDELPARDGSPPHKMRHPRNVRILPRSRDFH